MMQEHGHRFGGAWTQLKLDAVNYYLGFFTLVLKNKDFDLWYIDAFAGSGTWTTERLAGPLLENTPNEIVTEEFAGSVLRALDVSPSFKRHVFIEGNASRFQELEAIRAARPEKLIECRHGDANSELRAIFRTPPWSTQVGGRGPHRAVVFLDPYGMNVAWDTLRLLADTKAVDVWYLFPLQAVTRQLAIDLGRVDAYKQDRLDDIFGSPNWRKELYATEVYHNLFETSFSSPTRIATPKQIEEYSRSRLRTLFRYVSVPLPLLAEGRGHLFSLFCLSNSSSKAAIDLIEKGVNATLKRYGPASRHRSDR